MRSFPAMLAATIFVAATVLTSCGTRRVMPLTSESFAPTPSDQEVKLYRNELKRPHIKLAWVQSYASEKSTTAQRREQLQQLAAEARKLGADAVVSVRELNNRVRGFVTDEEVPFQSYRQGEYKMYFLRGLAIKFVEDAAEAEAALTPEAAAAENLTEVESTAPDDDAEMETMPKGLGQTETHP